MSRKELGTRLIFGPAMLAVVALIFWLDATVMAERGMRGVLSAGLLGLMAAGGAWEFGAMLRKAGLPIASGWLVTGTLALGATAFTVDWGQAAGEFAPPVFLAIGLVFVVALLWLAPTRIEGWLAAVGSTLLGFVMVAVPMYLAQGLALAHLPSVLFVVLVCKFGDIGAYFVGVAIGRRKLIPHVSPGKTLEGSLGGVVFSCVVSVLLAPHLLAPEVELGTLAAIGAGVVLNVTTQTGDLIESQLKRSCGTKDSSNLLPAHGGILDLIDSLLFSFPAYYIVLAILA